MSLASTIARELANSDRRGWTTLFAASASRRGVPVNLLLAVASQETRIGTGGLVGDGGHAHGIMQINDLFHPTFRDDDHAGVIDYGARLLASEKARRGTWKNALIAYNSGTACWSSGRATACARGRAYASKVIERWNVINQQRAMNGNDAPIFLPEPRSPFSAPIGISQTFFSAPTGSTSRTGTFDLPGISEVFKRETEATFARAAALFRQPSSREASLGQTVFPWALLATAAFVVYRATKAKER